MKRLLAMLSAAVTAIGLQAAEPYPSGTDFNGESWPNAEEAKLWTTNEFSRSDVAYTYSAADFKGGNVWLPAQFSDDTPAGKNLKIETGKPTVPIYRAISVTDDDDNTPESQTIGESGILVDTLVKFTAFDDDANLAATDENAKFAVWVKEVVEEEDAEPTYQLMVTAGKLNSDGDVAESANYACTLNADLADNISLTNWVRLTVKAIADFTDGYNIPGFVVCVNGRVVTSTEAANDIKAAGLNLSSIGAGWLLQGAIFPALVKNDQTIKQVGFAGTGWIDDLSITDTIPQFIQDAEFIYLTGGEHVASFTYGDKTWEKGDDALQCVLSSDLPSQATGITYESGYFGVDKQDVTKAAGAENVIGNAQALAATVTIDGEDDTLCATLADAVTAINAATADATLKLGADATGGITINNATGGITITIDLAGKTITKGETDEYAIYLSSVVSLVVKDSSEDHSGRVVGGVSSAAGTTTLEAGIYDGEVYLDGNGTDSITGGKFSESDNTADDLNEYAPEGKKFAADGDGYLVLVEDTETTWKTLLGEPDADGAYKIDDAADLLAFAKYVNGTDGVTALGTAGCTFKLTANIDMAGQTWLGIGVKGGVAFAGTFDGANCTISNLTLPHQNYAALFNNVGVATIKDVTVNVAGFAARTTELATGEADEYGGAAIVGYSTGGATISGCTATGTISGTHNVAGICCRPVNGITLTNCKNEANITTSYSKIGGMIAIAQGGTVVIEGCTNTGTVTADGTYTDNKGAAFNAGKDGVSGILAYEQSNPTVTIKNCVSTGELKATNASSEATDTAKIGTIKASGTSATYTEVSGNTARADLVASVDKAIDGLTFATVEDTTATFVANDALELAGTYKVMAAGAAYEFAATGSITFDTSLETVDVTMSTELSSDDYEITETKDETNEKVITYTLAKKATVKPVTPGAETTCKDKDEADKLVTEINGNKTTLIKVSEKLTEEQQSAYLELVAAKVVTTTTGDVTTYSVVVDLTEKAEETIQKQVDTKTKALEVSTIAAATGETVSQELTDVTPGIYYSVIAGPTLDDMGVRSSTMATGDTLSVTLPHYDGAGFYRIEASVNAQPVK